MDYERLEEIVELTRANPIEFRVGTKDAQQLSPLRRITSISKLLCHITLPPRDSTVIDIGTGYGYGAVLLNALGYNVLGIDSNKDKLSSGLAYWRSLGLGFEVISEIKPEQLRTKSKLYFTHRDARNLDGLPDDSIDMATAFYLGGYMLKNCSFKEVGRILKPGASFVLTTEGPISLPKFLRGLAVRVLAGIYKPDGMQYKRIFRINDSKVYDNHVVLMAKT